MDKRKPQTKRKFFAVIQFLTVSAGIFLVAIVPGCDFNFGEKEPEAVWDSLTVTASAYNSLRYQTGPGNPNVTAWGDTIAPGMKIIAVSRDLIKRGLDHNTPIKIEGFEGVYIVKDKMHYRWKNKIDIYMGENVERAKKWGRKKVKIYYLIPQEDTLSSRSIHQ